MLCQYSDIVGKPHEGFHKTRIPLINWALWDTIGTLFLAMITNQLLPFGSIWSHFIIWILLSIVIHYIFCVKSTLSMFVHSIEIFR